MHPIDANAYRLLHNGALAFGRAEQVGLRIDEAYCQRKQALLTKKIDRFRRQVVESDFGQRWKQRFGAKTNYSSNQQLAYMLYQEDGIKPPALTNTGQGSTSEETLKQLRHPHAEKIVRARQLTKLRDTYLASLMREQVNGVCHPFYQLHRVRTYRSSCTDPNFQNIPQRDAEANQLVRSAIYPRPGHQLVEIDYSQAEVRVGACYHGDPNMLREIQNPDADMHRDVAAQTFFLDYDPACKAHKALRGIAKGAFVFAQFYGDYYKPCAVNLACLQGGLPQSGEWQEDQGIPVDDDGTPLANHLRQHGIKSLADFTDHVQSIEARFWNHRFPVYKQWRKDWWREYRRRGYIDMLTGFRCSDLMTRNEATNTPIQGAAFHCLLWTFIETDRVEAKEKWDSKPVGQIHDSMLLDVHPDELDHVIRTVRRIGCEDIRKAWPWLRVPMEMDAEVCPVDRPWAEKEDYKLKGVVA